MIGQSVPGQGGWVTYRLWLATDGILFSGANAQNIERELDSLPDGRNLGWPAVESIPRHIGEILAKNGLEWLPQAPRGISGYGPAPRLDGLYVAQGFGWSYLRFSSGGRVSHVTSVGSPDEVAAWLVPERTDLSQGIYVVEDGELYFGVSSPESLVIFNGHILGANGALELRSRSKVTGHRETEIYTFAPLSMR